MKKIVFLLLVLLFFLDVYGTHKYLGILLGLFILIWYPLEFLKINRTEIILILFGITYVIFASFNIQIRIPIIYAFTLLPLIIFKIGKLSIGLFRTEKNIFLSLFIVLFALSFLFSYSVLIDYLNEGVKATRSIEIKFRNRSAEVLELNATLVGLHIVPLMSFLPLYFFQKKGELTKYFFVGSFLTISAIMVTIVTATRTPIIILGILLLINIYYGLKKVKNSNKRVILVLFSAIIYSVSRFDLANIELTSFLYERLTSDDLTAAGSRTEMWLLGLENIFKYPLGGEILYINYFHNLWLDLRYEAGVVPMILLILFSHSITYSCLKVVMSELYTSQFKSFIGSVYLVIFLTMFMEPVIQGSFVFFLHYIFFGGVLIGLRDITFRP